MRLHDWQPRLVAYLAAAARKPYEPGVHDCAIFAAGAVEAMTGTNHALPYKSHVAGFRALRKAGHADHVAYAASLLEEVPPSFAQAGDLAIVDGADGPAFGVVQGESIYVLSPSGMGFVPLTSAVRAFRV